VTSGISQTAGEIKNIVLTVPDCGQVYDYQPYPEGDWSEFVESFTATIAGARQVRAFTVQYIGERREEVAIGIGSQKQRRYMNWMVRAHMGHDGAASDIAFRDLVELVADALDKHRSLGAAAGAIDHDPCDISLPNSGAGVVLGDVLCHYAELTFESQHEMTLTVT
jgi:hypothetical protein